MDEKQVDNESNEKTKIVYLRMSPENHKKLKVVAAQNGQLMADIVDRVLTKYLDTQKC